MTGLDAEFVVTAPQILHERMTTDHPRRDPIRPQIAHWTEPGFEPSVIALDAVVIRYDISGAPIRCRVKFYDLVVGFGVFRRNEPGQAVVCGDCEVVLLLGRPSD